MELKYSTRVLALSRKWQIIEQKRETFSWKYWKLSLFYGKQLFCTRRFSARVKKSIWDSPSKCSSYVKSKTPICSNDISGTKKHQKQEDRKLEKKLTVHVWITENKQTIWLPRHQIREAKMHVLYDNQIAMPTVIWGICLLRAKATGYFGRQEEREKEIHCIMKGHQTE